MEFFKESHAGFKYVPHLTDEKRIAGVCFPATRNELPAMIHALDNAITSLEIDIKQNEQRDNNELLPDDFGAKKSDRERLSGTGDETDGDQG